MKASHNSLIVPNANLEKQPAWRFTIYGEAASKANQRRIVTSRASGKPISIKSKKALAYFHAAALQVPNLAKPFTVPVKVTIHLYYSTERPDLDESVLLDAMQSTYIGTGKKKRIVRSAIYTNDRLVRHKEIIHHIDAANPRAEVTVEELWPIRAIHEELIDQATKNRRLRAEMDAMGIEL